MKHRTIMTGWVARLFLCLCFSISTASTAQPNSVASNSDEEAPISRDDYERLKQEVQTLRREMQEIREQQKNGPDVDPGQPATAPVATPESAISDLESRQDDVDQTIADIEEDVRKMQRELGGLKFGSTNFLLTGNATLGYVDRENADSTFGATFRPVFLWRIDDRLLFESKLELRLQSDEEDVETRVEYANLTYLVGDNLWLGVGKFLTPFGLFPERFYPGRVADEPLVYAQNGLVPHSSVGAFVRGALPVSSEGGAELNYAAYVINGPSLQTDATDAGLLRYDNNIDSNNAKSVGGRVGFLPNPDLEIGASVMYGDVDPSDFDDDVRALLLGVDLQYFKQIDWLRGNLDVRAEWIWSDLSDATYDPSGALGFGPLTFDNRRDGGYVELSYRPAMLDAEILKDTEFVVRYDLLNAPSGAPGPGDQQRWTLAVLYWIRPTIALRAGYALDDKQDTDDQDLFFAQVIVGL